MAFPGLQTPQRPLPGAFFNTPAASRFDARPPLPPLFQPAAVVAGAGPTPALIPAGQQTPDPARQQSSNRSLQPIQRAARTINEVLLKEANFPDLDSYVRQGTSSDYEIPNPLNESAWSPFTRTKMYDIPDRVLAQWNNAEAAGQMGLFAELNHAWMSIDNALYLWDYTNPNPEIIGYEEQPNLITAVRLVKPRAGVFVSAISHLLLVVTTVEIVLLGVETSIGSSGVRTVSLYQTKMMLNIKGISVQVIEGSPATGRIFFSGKEDYELYELTYQKEEKWFSSRCGRVNHTSPGYTSLVPTSMFSQKSKESIVSIVVDDSRHLVYTLSSESSIRTFYMENSATLQQVIEKKRQECLRDISHMGNSTLLPSNMKIVSISPISSREGSKLHLMATTSTGCRIFLSATRGYGYLATGGAPQSMQVQHIKFPPPTSAQSSTPGQYTQAQPATDTSSLSLNVTRLGPRFPPGFFFCFVSKQSTTVREALFLSGPDTARIAAQARDLSTQASRYFEQGCWMELSSVVEDVGLVTKPFAATSQPVGFGNELAVQFDEPPTEVAILTTSGIHIIRRRRLVDIFAAAIRSHGGDDGLENEIKKFIRQYGRGETTATALAVACGQGSDVAPGDMRAVRVSEPETLDLARKCFVEYGGRPSVDQNSISEGPAHAVDNVRPSSRHDGLAVYMGRLVRSLWKAPVITVKMDPSKKLSILTTVQLTKLSAVQDDLTRLSKFLEKNKSFIEGLAGPDSLQRGASQQEEIALQGEHQALYSLQVLNANIIEGISFVLMLFDERVDLIWSDLDRNTQTRLRELTYETLFATDQGRELAKVLVKAIVNRNIANGSSVDTVADALRRRCGSFCSADDVVIFKAQEQLKKAAENGANTDGGRALLNESLRLFTQVAGALSYENLHSAASKFVDLEFYAGAIQISLLVAKESDRGNKALAWVRDGQPADDERVGAYNFRKQCYDLVHHILQTVDSVANHQPELIDGRPTLVAKKRNEAHSVINDSDDEVFHFDLYQWYIAQGWIDRLLAVKSDFIVPYLVKMARNDLSRAELLWRFYVHNEQYFNAAEVLLDLAKSSFTIPLATRIEYLGRAKANASAQSGGIGRQQRQVLLYEVSELIEIANIQDEILVRIRNEPRIAPDRKDGALKVLDGPIQSCNDLFNTYADPGRYFDICLLILETVSHRQLSDVTTTWQYYLEQIYANVIRDPNPTHQPFEAIVNTMRDMGARLGYSEGTFSPTQLIPMVETFVVEHDIEGPPSWIPDIFIEVKFPFESIVSVLGDLIDSETQPFIGPRKSLLAQHSLYVLQEWYNDCVRHNKVIFGSDGNALAIDDILVDFVKSQLLPPSQIEQANTLRGQIGNYLASQF